MSLLAPPVTTRVPARDSSVLPLHSSPTAATRLTACAELAKPRIALMVLLSVGVGYLMAAAGNWDTPNFLKAATGIVLAVIASSSLNQYLERLTDGRMQRTRYRPLPTRRLAPVEVLVMGLICGIVACVLLALTVNVLTASLTLLTIVLYAGVYTPLKRYTSLCTAIGAIPGAMPPVLGWTAAGAPLDWGAFSLFAILFLWQFPHFLAIAWIYQDQYEAAGLKMVPGRGRPGVLSAISTLYALALIPVSLLPCQVGLCGSGYAWAAMILGVIYLLSSIQFQFHETRAGARRVLWTSLLYLPCILIALTWDHIRLLS